MANKVLKSLTFPGLNDVYKIPQEADEYSTSATYAVGDYCIKDGVLYRCTTAITTAEAWTAGHWTATQLADEVTSQSEKIDALNGNREIDITEFSGTVNVNGATAKYSNGNIELYGTISGARYYCCINGQNIVKTSGAGFEQTLPAGLYVVHITSSNYPAPEQLALAYSTSTFANASFAFDGDIIKTDEPIMVGLFLYKNLNFGTEANPTVVSINLTKYVEKADQEYAEYLEQTISDSTNNVKQFSNFLDGYIDTSGSSVNVENPGEASGWKHIVIPCEENDGFIFKSLGGGNDALLYCFCDESYNILEKSYTTSTSQVSTITAFDNLVIHKAPAGAKYLVSNHHGRVSNGYKPIIYKVTNNELANYIATRVTAELPFKTINDWENKVVATYENMIAIKDGNLLKISKDLGETWNTGVNVSAVGDIRNFYMFANGCLAFFTETKAYYTENFETYSEASCYEQDGTAFTPQEIDNFNPLWCHAERKFIDNQDMYVFCNYNLERTERRLLWYSIDNGHTYKIAYEFALESTYPARHIHDVIYYNTEDVFIVSTGDSNATECSVYAFEYDTSLDSWSVTQLAGSARDYKWANIGIYREEIYYTYDSTPGKVMKCKYSDIDDVSKHIVVLENTENDALSLCFGKNGEMVVTQSTYRSTGSADVPIDMYYSEAARIMYYSTNRKDFNAVVMPLNFINGFSPNSKFLPVLNDGRCFCTTTQKDTLPSLNVGDFLNTIGYRQAFKQF